VEATLVLGYGSELRSDDAAGLHVANAVAQRELPGVAVRTAHQLTPELAADIEGRGRVVFVDASVDVAEVEVRWLEADPARPPGSHHVDPGGLLALAAMLGNAPPEAVVVRVPVTSLDVGFGLTAPAAAAVEEAVEEVLALCAEQEQG